MLFPETDAPELKTWIVKHLETPAASDSDVDADVLADYVLALLRHDGNADDVRQLCETELYDFLKDEAKPFVASVFEAVVSRSYKPGARPPPSHPATGPSQTSLPPLPPNGSKKRSYHESSLPAKPAADTAAAVQGNGRATKQPRRGGGRGGRENGRGGAGQMVDYLPPPPFGASGSRESSPPSGSGAAAAPYFPSVPPSMEALMHMSQMGMPVGMYGFPPGMAGPWGGPGANGHGAGKRSRRRCRYMEKNGFCTKKNCAFDHGDSLPDGEAAAFHAAHGFEGGFHPMLQHAEAAAAMFQQMMPPLLSPMGAGSTRGGRKPRRGGRAAFSADGPVFDKTNTTVVVEGIPDEFLHEDAVREFFSQFGTLVSIAMQPPRKLAIVQFDTWAAAHAAYQSPKVIFDNRFVKVYWHRDDKGDGADAPAAAASEDGEVVEGGGSGSAHAGPGWRSQGADSPEIDMEDFLRRQEEAQQRHDDKMQKKQELEAKRQELEQRQRALQIRQQEEKQRLIAKMAEVATRARQDSASGTPSEDGSTPKTAAISQTEMIRAQLAALEEEARQLGLDPDAVAVVTGSGGDASSTTSSSLSFAGRGRGRGRGGFFPYRGRGGGGRGGRGGGGSGVSSSVSAAYAAYSLDNRPRRIALTGVDFTVPEQGEALRAHLLIVGDFADMETTPDKTTISFVDRRTAEKFYLSAKVAGTAEAGKTAGRTIPGVDGLVELAWVPNTAASTATRASSGPASVSTTSGSRRNDAKVPLEDDTAMDESVHDDEPGEDAQDHQQQEQKHEPHAFPPKPRQMDFDVADEGDWDLA